MGEILGLEVQSRVGFRTGEDLKGQLDQHPEMSQAADHQLGKIKPGGVFDDLATARNEFAPTVYERHPEQKVTDAAVAQTPRPGQSGSDGTAQGCARLGEGRVEGEVLTFGSQHLVYFAKATGVPASAVKVYSCGVYSRTPETSFRSRFAHRARVPPCYPRLEPGAFGPA